MRQTRTNGIAKIAALLAFALLASLLFAQSSVTIQSVDNYAGNSNVYTDAPNTDVKITELDHNGNPVRSWTGRTDSDGKITIPAGSNLSKPYLRATKVGNMPEMVLPSTITSESPFLFSTGGTESGEVVTIHSVNGAVVARRTTDDKGRVYVAAGLAVGLYNMLIGDGNSRRVGQVEIKPRPQDALQRPGQNPPIPLKVNPISTPFEVDEMVRLSGSGFNPDPQTLVALFKSDEMGAGASAQIPQWLQDLLDGKYLIKNMDVLAATSSEMVVQAPKGAGILPGQRGSIVVGDGSSKQLAETNKTFTYDAQSRLIRNVVPSGAGTSLEVRVSPEDLNADVLVRVVRGPVSLPNGQKEMSMPLRNGAAVFPIQSEPGSEGQFQLAWSLNWLEKYGEMWQAAADKVAGIANNLMQDARPGSRKAGHTIKRADGGWTDEYTDYDADGNRIGRSSETYDKNGRLRERKTTRDAAGGGRTEQTDTYDDKGKWTGTESKSFDKDGKQTGGTKTAPDGKGGTTTQTYDPKTGTYK